MQQAKESAYDTHTCNDAQYICNVSTAPFVHGTQRIPNSTSISTSITDLKDRQQGALSCSAHVVQCK